MKTAQSILCLIFAIGIFPRAWCADTGVVRQETIEHARFPERIKVDFIPPSLEYVVTAHHNASAGSQSTVTKKFVVTYQDSRDKGNYHYQISTSVDWTGECSVLVHVFVLNPFGKAAAYSAIAGGTTGVNRSAQCNITTQTSFFKATIPVSGLPFPLPLGSIYQSNNTSTAAPLMGGPGFIESPPIEHPPTTFIHFTKQVYVTADAQARQRFGGRAVAVARIFAIPASLVGSDVLEFTWDGN